MTGSLRFMPRNVGDLATLTCVLPASTLTPVTNLQKDRRSRVFRWDPKGGSPSGQVVIGTYPTGTQYYMSCLGLDRNNFSSAALIRFRGYASNDTSGAAIIDTGSISAYNASALGPFTWGTSAAGAIQDGYLGYQYTVAYFARQLCGSFRLDISDDGNAAGYNEIERLVLGDYTELLRNAAWGIKFKWDEKTTQDEADDGSTIADGRIPRRVVTGMLPGLTPAERTLFADFTRFVGMRKSFLMAFQPGEGASIERDLTILQAKFPQLPEISWDLPDCYSVQFSIFES